LVSPGEYFENINFHGKNIVLTSNFILNSDTSFIANTIINGNQKGSVITINSGEDSTTQLIGFTITNGHSYYGAGVFCENSNPRLSNLKVNGNITGDCGTNAGHPTGGAGIFMNGCNSSLVNISLMNNNALCPGPRMGYSWIAIINSNVSLNKIDNIGPTGIFIDSSNINIKNSNLSGGFYTLNSSLSILESRISGYNSKGGIYVVNMSKFKLENVEISNSISTNGGGIHAENSEISFNNIKVLNNTAGSDGQVSIGGGMFLNNCRGNIKKALLSGNQTSYYGIGGGAYIINCNLQFDDFIVSNNTSANRAGGMYIESSELLFNFALITGNNSSGSYTSPPNSPAFEINNCSPIFNKATIASNSAWHPGYSYSNLLFVGNSEPKFINSIIWWTTQTIDNGIGGNAKIYFSDVLNGWEGEGNINANPSFVNADSNNYALSPYSTLIDKGIAYYSVNDTVIVNMQQNEYLGKAPDMGYYETEATNTTQFFERITDGGVVNDNKASTGNN
jgi:hypothetical protein